MKRPPDFLAGTKSLPSGTMLQNVLESQGKPSIYELENSNYLKYYISFGCIIVYISIFNINDTFAYLIFLWLGNVLSGFENDIKDKKCQEKTCKVAKCQEHNKALCHAHDWNRHLCH